MYDTLVHCPTSYEDLEKINLAELYNKRRCKIFCTYDGEALSES